MDRGSCANVPPPPTSQLATGTLSSLVNNTLLFYSPSRVPFNAVACSLARFALRTRTQLSMVRLTLVVAFDAFSSRRSLAVLDGQVTARKNSTFRTQRTQRHLVQPSVCRVAPVILLLFCSQWS